MGMSCACMCLHVCACARSRSLSPPPSLSFPFTRLCTRESHVYTRRYIRPSRHRAASPRLRARPSWRYTRFRVVRLYTVVRRREERPRWHGSALRYSGFLHKGKEREGNGFCLYLSSRHAEGEHSLTENAETSRCAKARGGSRGRGREKREARVQPTGLSVMPAFALRRGEPTWVVPDGDWVPRRVGLGTSVAPRGLYQSAAPSVAFLSCYLRRGRRRTVPPSGVPRHLPRTRTLRAHHPALTRSPCVQLVGAGEDTLVSGSVEVARVFTSPREECRVCVCCCCCVVVAAAASNALSCAPVSHRYVFG